MKRTPGTVARVKKARKETSQLESTNEDHLRRAFYPYPVKKIEWEKWPDRVIWLPERPLLVELKRPKGGRFETGQLRMHAKLRRLGYTVLTLYTKAAITRCAKKYLP